MQYFSLNTNPHLVIGSWMHKVRLRMKLDCDSET